MPRIGSTSEERSQGTQFSFPEGNGEIVAAKVVNHAIPGYGADCGYLLTIRPLNKDWQPTGGEDVEEFVKAGPCSAKDGSPLFHPGNAKSSDDTDPELEIGGRLDCGGEDGAEGTCILTAGRGPDRKAKISIFTDSCIEHGVKPGLFNGYAANLIGLKAHFTQYLMERVATSTAKNDPTCLAIGTNGKFDPNAKVAQYPFAQTGGKAPAMTAKTAGTTAGAGKVNGAPAAGTSAVSAGGGADQEELESLAIQHMMREAEAKPGETVEKGKFLGRVPVMLAKAKIPHTQHKGIQAFLKNDAWFAEKAEMLSWAVAGDQITFPSA